MKIKFHALKDHVNVVGDGATVEVEADFVDPNSLEMDRDSYSQRTLENLMANMNQRDVLSVVKDMFDPEDLQ